MDTQHPTRDFYQFPLGTVRHYYGDVARLLFILVAILIGISIPLGDNFSAGVASGAPLIVLLVVLAGLTNPHGKIVLVLDAIVSLLGVMVAQTIALSYYANDNMTLFGIFEIMSLLLLIALYFSVKTVRAMMTNKIGHGSGVGEFDE